MREFKFLSNNTNRSIPQGSYTRVYNEGWNEASRHIELNPVRSRFSVWDICPYWVWSDEYIEWEKGYDDRWSHHNDIVIE